MSIWASLTFTPLSISPPYFMLVVDTIPGAETAYDVLLLLLISSIACLLLLRYCLEYRERLKVYERYIRAAKGQTEVQKQGSPQISDSPKWMFWSAEHFITSTSSLGQPADEEECIELDDLPTRLR
jgi:hypothetical protein